MFNTDAGNFNRFRTSLGLVLLAASLLIPYFFFRATSVLEISADELNGLSETSRSVIEGRQAGIETLEPYVLALSGVLALTGLALLLMGGLGLRKAQESEDAVVDLRKARAQAGMRSLSHDEREERAAEQAEEDLHDMGEAEQSVGASASPKIQDSAHDEGDGGPGAPGDAYRDQLAQRMVAIRRIEDKVASVLGHHVSGTHRYKEQLAITNMDDSIRVDGLFEAQAPDRYDDVVVEVRIQSAGGTWKRNARNHANELIALGYRYMAMTKRQARGWLVVVVPKGEAIDIATRESATENLKRAMSSFGSAILLPEDQLDELPREFEDQFAKPRDELAALGHPRVL